MNKSCEATAGQSCSSDGTAMKRIYWNLWLQAVSILCGGQYCIRKSSGPETYCSARDYARIHDRPQWFKERKQSVGIFWISSVRITLAHRLHSESFVSDNPTRLQVSIQMSKWIERVIRIPRMEFEEHGIFSSWKSGLTTRGGVKILLLQSWEFSGV